jgi:two-component system response regulator NreC
MPTRILVVDDSAAIRCALRHRIEEETDWEICGEAENGKVAVEMVRQFLPDVIVLDLAMPVMNGLEAARQIREIAPDAYILLFTLHALPQLLEDAEKAGINRVLSKSGCAGSSALYAIRALVGT